MGLGKLLPQAHWWVSQARGEVCIVPKGGPLLLAPSHKTSRTSDLFHHVEHHLMQDDELVPQLHCCKIIDSW